jgi:hypothetical protein
LAPSNPEARLQQDIAGLALFPRLSRSANRTRMQRSNSYELSVHKTVGSRAYSAGAYVEKVRNLSVALAGATDALDQADLLPDIASTSSLFNLGTYSAHGYLAGVTQSLGARWSVGGAYGQGTALSQNTPVVVDALELRAAFQPRFQQWATTRLSGLLPVTGTHLTAVYLWSPAGSFAPAHAWVTQRFQPVAGLNVSIRQPLPSMGAPGRLEASAEIRNAFSQGYSSLWTADNRQLLLVQFPKSIRGGLSFIF